MKHTLQRAANDRRPALWLRLLTVFCTVLLGIASTVQACHSHDDAFEDGLLKAGTSVVAAQTHNGDAAAAVFAAKASRQDGSKRVPGSESAVRCPLCVAMHSAMPVTGVLVEVALVRLNVLTPAADGIERTFRWRFEMASRPPPATRVLA